MTREEIIKALRCAAHANNCPVEVCNNKCPYFVEDVVIAENEYIWANEAAGLIEKLSAECGAWKQREEAAENCIERIFVAVSPDMAEDDPCRSFVSRIQRIIREWSGLCEDNGGA